MSHMYMGLSKHLKSDSFAMLTQKQRSLITNQQQIGFSSQAKRFPSQVSLNENPGPGSYGLISNAEDQSPSYSKKGTTGFVPSKAARATNKQRSTPAPNAYNLQRPFINKQDFNLGVSRVFRLPVALQSDGLKHRSPAPNQYDVSCVNRLVCVSSVVGTSSFLSRTQRDSFYPIANIPAPCHYEVNKLQPGSMAVLSPFKSKSQRIPALVDNGVPGPGAYSPHQTPTPVKKTVRPRGHYLALAAPPLILPKDPPLPGPGQYDIGKYNGQTMKPKPTAAFASRTERRPHTLQVDVGPGPGFYDPQILPKQSFFYNDSRVWIPV